MSAKCLVIFEESNVKSVYGKAGIISGADL